MTEHKLSVIKTFFQTFQTDQQIRSAAIEIFLFYLGCAALLTNERNETKNRKKKDQQFNICEMRSVHDDDQIAFMCCCCCCCL